MKHPKGPYIASVTEYGEDAIITTPYRYDADKAPLATVEIGFDEPFESEQQAVLRLFTLAPDMYELLESVLLEVGMGEGLEAEWRALKAKIDGDALPVL